MPEHLVTLDNQYTAVHFFITACDAVLVLVLMGKMLYILLFYWSELTTSGVQRTIFTDMSVLLA